MAVRNTLQTRETSLWVNSTHAVILETSAIISSLNATEAAQNAYVICGARADRERWQRHLSDVNEHLQVAQPLTADNPPHQKHFLELTPAVQRRLKFSQQLVDIREKEGAAPAMKLLDGSTTADAREQPEALAEVLVLDENALLARRDQESFRNARATRIILWIGLLLNGVLLAAGFWLVRDDLKVRRQHAANLASANETLERTVQERTSELSVSNEALSLENLERRWAYASLEKNYRHGQCIIESLSEMVVIVGTTGLIHESNPAAEAAAGGLIGKPLREVLSPSREACRWDVHPVKKALGSPQPLSDQQGWLRSAQGVPRPVHLQRPAHRRFGLRCHGGGWDEVL